MNPFNSADQKRSTVEFNVVRIKLGNIGKLKGSCALIDRDDLEKISKYRWVARASKERTYVQHIINRKDGKYHALHLHRLIMDAPSNMMVDHINGNGLDNRKCDLRVCTHAQNQRNGNKKRKNGTKYKGISLHKSQYNGPQRWEAFISFNGKKIHAGIFLKEEDAATAYNITALRYFREYSKLNYIP